MKIERDQALLRQGMTELHRARKHLDFSASRVAGFPADLEGVHGEPLESAEAFTTRFARVVDLLVNKVLRTLDRVELLPEGTLLDVVHRAEKRGFISDASLLREMKGVRNVIAHDYAGVQLAEIVAYCRAKKAALDAVCDAVEAYVQSVSHSQSAHRADLERARPDIS
jgi:uncharacterized protein YutE (UPF0331/DUF86 family)